MGWHSKCVDGESKILVDIVRCLALKSGSDILDDCLSFIEAGSAEAFELRFNQSHLSCKPWTLQDCFLIIAKALALTSHPQLATIIRIALGRRQIDRQITSLKDQYGSRLLHYTSKYLGEHHAAIMWRGWIEELRKAGAETRALDSTDVFLSHWSQFELEVNLILVRDLVSAGSCLLERNDWLHTPLLEICRGISCLCTTGIVLPYVISNVSPSWQKILVQSLEVPIQVWLHQIARAGVDLMEYGRRESRLHRKPGVEKQWDFYDWSRDSSIYGGKFFTMRLISFTYGPSPEDWQFWFTEAMESFFCEFWHMVDHPEQAMPGAWNEHDEHDDNEAWLDDDSSSEYSCSNDNVSDFEGEDEEGDEDGDVNGDGDKDNDIGEMVTQ